MNNLIFKTAIDLGMPVNIVSNFYKTAPHRYKVFTIPKKQKGKYRIIAQPAKSIKVIQRYLVATVLKGLPVHEAATAYRKGSSIKLNAEKHKNNKYLLKMDFSDFFPSIGVNDVKRHLKKNLDDIWSDEEIRMLSHMVLWRPKGEYALKLSIGAPSSPHISNSLMYGFDDIVSRYCNHSKITYTRYADDLYFSTDIPHILKETEKYIHVRLEELKYPKLKINELKTVHTSKKHKRNITGLIINNDGEISLGRERKREISSMLHYGINERLPEKGMRKLHGLLAFAYDVEPHFLVRMKKKYGEEYILKILSLPWGD